MHFFNILVDFFYVVFLGNTPEGKRRKAMRKILDTLKRRDPPIYKDGMVLPAFASNVLTFCQLLRPVKEIYDATLGNEDTQLANKYHDFFIESVLTVEQKDDRGALQYDSRKSALFDAVNSQEAFAEQERVLSRFIKGLDGAAAATAAKQLCQLDALGDICRFNYGNLLGFFDPAFSPASEDAVPHFEPVALKLLSADIADLYYVLHGFQFDMGFSDMLLTLKKRSDGAELTDDDKVKFTRAIKNLSAFMSEQLPVELLEALIKAAQDNPDFTPSFNTSQRDYTREYRERFIKQYKNETDRLSREVQEDTLFSSIKELFPDMQLLPISGYDEENGKFIQDCSPWSFMWVKPLKIIRTFYNRYFNDELKNVINAVFVGGFFISKEFETKLSGSFQYCVGLEERFGEFEASFAPGGKNDASALRARFSVVHPDDEFVKQTERIVDNINRTAKDLVQTETSKIEEFTSCVRDLVSDSKKVKPELIANIRSLGGAEAKDYIGLLENREGFADKFIKLMKNYALVHNN